MFYSNSLCHATVNGELSNLRRTLPVNDCSCGHSGPMILRHAHGSLQYANAISICRGDRQRIRFVFSITNFLFPFSIFILYVSSRSFQGCLTRCTTSYDGGTSQIVARVRGRLLRSLVLRVYGYFFVLLTNRLEGFKSPSVTNISKGRLVKGNLSLRVPSLRFSVPNFLFIFPLCNRHCKDFLAIASREDGV